MCTILSGWDGAYKGTLDTNRVGLMGYFFIIVVVVFVFVLFFICFVCLFVCLFLFFVVFVCYCFGIVLFLFFVYYCSMLNLKPQDIYRKTFTRLNLQNKL